MWNIRVVTAAATRRTTISAVTITVTRPEKIPLADNVIKIKTKEEGVVISLKIKIKS